MSPSGCIKLPANLIRFHKINIQKTVLLDYRHRSTKAGTRLQRGDPGPRTHIKGTSQNMLQGLRWKELLHNNDNKTDLIELL